MSPVLPTVVVPAYDRPHSLRRLLTALTDARYTTAVRLVISVDRSESDEVLRMAREFPWPFGEKRVIARPERLGLREHILQCGDLTAEYGSVILLEDDLYVSPFFYEYVVAALEHYADDPRISGLSLYGGRFNATASLAFTPLNDGSDVFFQQLPSSWGQCWTNTQWKAFRIWYQRHGGSSIDEASTVPRNVLRWPETSWSKYFVKYMIDEGTYFVYPRESLTTNFGDPGEHFKDRYTFWQVPLQLEPRTYVFKTLTESNAVYDAHCEIDPDRLRRLAPPLAGYDFDVDFYGMKEIGKLTRPYVLTSRRVTSAVQSFALALKPHEMNAVRQISGHDLHLARRADCARDFAEITPERVSFYHDVPEWRFIFRGQKDPRLRDRHAILKAKLRALGLQHREMQHQHAEAVTNLEAKVRTLEARHRDIRRQYQDIVTSRGWSLTKPFRIVSRYLREIASGSSATAKNIVKGKPMVEKGQ